jgi:hypothetical protein
MKFFRYLLLLAFLLALPVAFAYTTMDSNPRIQNIEVGSTGIYTISVNTDYLGEHIIGFDTNSDYLKAKIYPQGGPEPASFTKVGMLTWTPTSGEGTYFFTYKVQPQSGITLYTEYEMGIYESYATSPFIVRAMATAGVVPIPEMATAIMVGLGILGMIGYSRIQKLSAA